MFSFTTTLPPYITFIFFTLVINLNARKTNFKNRHEGLCDLEVNLVTICIHKFNK